MKKILALISFLLFLLIFLGIPVRVDAAPYGNFLELSGGYIQTVNQNNNLHIVPSFSFEAWIKPEKASGIQKIVSITDGINNNPSYELAINGGSLVFLVRNSSGSVNLLSGGTRQIIPGVWNHVAATVDANSMEIFIDGIRINNMGGINNLSVIEKTIILGGSLFSSPQTADNFIGSMDEIRISSVKRDIISLYKSGVYNGGLIQDAGTVLFWHLDESRGETVAKDVSSNKLDGTLTGTDSQIHFYGVLPTPTPWNYLPPIRWTMPVLPTLSIPTITFTFPTQTATFPREDSPTPTPFFSRHLPRPSRQSTR